MDTEAPTGGRRLEIVVSVDDAHLGTIQQVVEALSELGMTVERRLDSIGVIGGVVDPRMVPAIEKVKGVDGVEFAREFQLPRPDSPVQ